jgi:pre-rRNA-processing protein TSR1
MPGSSSSREDRRNKAKQVRDLKRAKIVSKNRELTSAPPRLLALIPITTGANTTQVRDKIIKACGNATKSSRLGHTVSLGNKKRLTIVETGRTLTHVLDIVSVADMTAFVVDAGEDVAATGNHFLTCLNSQGLPTPLVLFSGLDVLPDKRRGEVKKAYQKFFSDQFHEEPKMASIDSKQEMEALLRVLAETKIHHPSGRDRRGHVLADSVAAAANPDGETLTVRIGGYVRGRNLTANQLCHVSAFGTFQIAQIERGGDPHPLATSSMSRRASAAGAMDAEDCGTLLPDAAQESLVMENTADPLANEQTWPTEEELNDASKAKKKKLVRRTKRPAGMSDYQAAWMEFDSAYEGEVVEVDADEEMEDDDDAMKESDESESSEEEEESEEEAAAAVAADSGGEEDSDDDMGDGQTLEELEKERKRLRDAAYADVEFPDEVDTPLTKPARTRFARYRGMKSFRTSPWDPKESLPEDYAKVFQVGDWRAARKQALKSFDGGADVGEYVTLVLKDVPKKFLEVFLATPAAAARPLIAGCLLKHENRMSVLHFTLSRHADYTAPIKSKDELLFVCGFRRWTARAVFSEATKRTDRCKFERYLQMGRTSIASVYAPVCYAPQPLLVFKRKPSGTLLLVATGGLMAADTDKIILKRIVLSGYPFKVHRRRSTIRFMFFNPEDIRWFKPVELWTKNGRTGHITEPLGTHGYFKALFDAPLSQADVVCMSLYKRVYPKYPTGPVDLLLL